MEARKQITQESRLKNQIKRNLTQINKSTEKEERLQKLKQSKEVERLKVEKNIAIELLKTELKVKVAQDEISKPEQPKIYTVKKVAIKPTTKPDIKSKS